VIYHCRLLAGTSTEHDADLFLQAFALLGSDQDTTERAAQVEALADQCWRGKTAMQHPELLLHGTVRVE
jgi:hypothetical protein